MVYAFMICILAPQFFHIFKIHYLSTSINKNTLLYYLLCTDCDKCSPITFTHLPYNYISFKCPPWLTKHRFFKRLYALGGSLASEWFFFRCDGVGLKFHLAKRPVSVHMQSMLANTARSIQHTTRTYGQRQDINTHKIHTMYLSPIYYSRSVMHFVLIFTVFVLFGFADDDDATTSGVTLDDVEKRVIFLNQTQPQKFCNNHISTAKYK